MKTFYIFYLLISLPFFSYSQEVSTFTSDTSYVFDDALIIDSSDNIYGSNFNGSSVYKISPTGDISTFASGLSNPNGLAFDTNNDFYIVEYSANKIHKYNLSGNLLQTFNITDGTASNLISAFDGDGVIFTNVVDHSINRISMTGLITKIFVGAPLDVPVGMTYGPDGSLYVGNYVDRKIHIIDTDNDISYVATIASGTSNFPYLGFIEFANDLIFATIYGQHKIYSVDPSKVNDVKVFSGSSNETTDGILEEAKFSYPAGIVYNANQDALYISQFFNGSVRKITNVSSYEHTIIDTTTTTGIHDISKFAFNVYPNPVSNFTNIKGKLNNSNGGQYEILIYNLANQLVFEKKAFAKSNVVEESIPANLFHLGNSAQIYSVHIKSKNGIGSSLICVQ